MNMAKHCRRNRRIHQRSFTATLIVAVMTGVLFGAQDSSAAERMVEKLAGAKFERVAGPESSGSVLDVGGSGSWFESFVWAPTIDYDGQLYRMWFSGAAKTEDPDVPYGWYERLGLAISRDGLHWELGNDGQPVLDLGPPGSVDAKGLDHPYVLRVGEQFMMWYGGIDGKQAVDHGLGPGHVRIERVCLATSHDGVHWTRANNGQPVLNIGTKESIDSIQASGMHVLRIDGQYVMWYGAYDGMHRLGIATSPDGIHWTKGNHGKPLTGLRGKQQLGPSVYYQAGRYFMLYNTDWRGGWSTYAATSDDGIHWTQLHDGQPVLGAPPAGNFDEAGRGSNFCVHPTKMLIQADKVRVWYGGEMSGGPGYQRIGLMEASLLGR